MSASLSEGEVHAIDGVGFAGTDEARSAAAETIADQIERSNLEIRQKPPLRGHSTP